MAHLMEKYLTEANEKKEEKDREREKKKRVELN